VCNQVALSAWLSLMGAFILPAIMLVVSTWIFFDMLDDTIKEIREWHKKRR
jgi:hypothetical protein